MSAEPIDPDTCRTVGARLRFLRLATTPLRPDKRRMSVEEAAALANMGDSTVDRCEADKGSKASAVSLAVALGGEDCWLLVNAPHEKWLAAVARMQMTARPNVGRRSTRPDAA